MDQLAEEENNGKAVLDHNHKLQQDLAQMEEEVKDAKEQHAANREEIIALRLKLSQLTVQEERKGEELKKLQTENTALIKENDGFDQENAKLKKEIDVTIQRIDINNLLKHIDLEDVRLQAVNNNKMTGMINSLINKWQQLETSVDP